MPVNGYRVVSRRETTQHHDGLYADVADAIDFGALKHPQDRIRIDLAGLDRSLANGHGQHQRTRKHFGTELHLFMDLGQMYLHRRSKQTAGEPSFHQRYQDQRRQKSDDPTR